VFARTPALNPAFAIAEALWLLAGSNEAAVLHYWFPGLPKFQGDGPTYPGAYGHRLRRQFGVDQIRRAYEALSANPDTRQVVLQIWDVTTDLPGSNGAPRGQDIPCNVCSMLKLRDSRLDWTQIMRSNDLYRGLPHNIVQFTMLQEVLAGWLGVDVGRYHHWSDSLHAYRSDGDEFACRPTGRIERNTDSLAVEAAAGLQLIEEMYARLVQLTARDLTREAALRLAAMPDAPPGYANFLRLLAADSARRRKWREESAALMADCTNPQLQQLWSAWVRRIGS
jgi:thymidylate synthase